MTAAGLVPLLLGLAASVATLLGGWVALRLADRLTLVLGLAAGIVLGVALFDLFPEALEMAEPGRMPHAVFGYVGIGFGGYFIADRLLDGLGRGGAPWRPHLGPATLTTHSFLDGMGIGLAFQVSERIGWVVALAVLAHDVADGVNTVSLSLASSRQAVARRWLLANGLAPLAGVVVGSLVRMPPALLSAFVAAFGGVFLFIGACELLPRSRARDPRLRVGAATLAGIGFMFVVTQVAA